jgi:two-component system chemotaxis response regulator CheB
MPVNSAETLSLLPAAREVVAMAASVGGLRALGDVLSSLPTDFDAAIVIVQHLDPHHHSLMAELLGRRTRLPVSQANHKSLLTPGTAWVAPPDHHLLVEAGGTLALTQTDRVHHLRPAADPLLESLAGYARERATAVILTGSGTDGAAGVRAIKARGGTVIAQDQNSSENWGMPHAAILTGCVDMILPLEKIGQALMKLIAARQAHE